MRRIDHCTDVLTSPDNGEKRPNGKTGNEYCGKSDQSVLHLVDTAVMPIVRNLIRDDRTASTTGEILIPLTDVDLVIVRRLPRLREGLRFDTRPSEERFRSG